MINHNWFDIWLWLQIKDHMKTSSWVVIATSRIGRLGNFELNILKNRGCSAASVTVTSPFRLILRIRSYPDSETWSSWESSTIVQPFERKPYVSQDNTRHSRLMMYEMTDLVEPLRGWLTSIPTRSRSRRARLAPDAKLPLPSSRATTSRRRASSHLSGSSRRWLAA